MVQYINPVWSDEDLARGERTGMRMKCPGTGERVILADRVPKVLPEWARDLHPAFAGITHEPTDYYRKFIEEINRDGM